MKTQTSTIMIYFKYLILAFHCKKKTADGTKNTNNCVSSKDNLNIYLVKCGK